MSSTRVFLPEMGTSGDVETGNRFISSKDDLNVDLSNAATQQVDSQFSPGGDIRTGGTDDFHYPTSMMPIDDNYLVEGSLETQLVDLDGETLMSLAAETQFVELAEETQSVYLAEETQSIYLAEETQLMNFACETQVLDDFDRVNHVPTQLIDHFDENQVLDDFDCFMNRPTELFNICNIEVSGAGDNEIANKGKVMCDTQPLSQDDFLKADGRDLDTHMNMVDTYFGSHGDSVCGTPSDCITVENNRSGSIHRDFTSIRAASIRASGLAALARGASGNLYSSSGDRSSLEQQKCKQQDAFLHGDLFKSGRKNKEESLWNGYDNESSQKLRNPLKCKGRSTVRKLFTEERVVEVGASEADINQTDGHLNMTEVVASENCLGGLSYVNSEEPGDLSQANALEVVDRFLELNTMEHDQGVDCRIHIAEKQNVNNGVKGSRDLAKNSILRSSDVECRAYDWDDTREDEGGGDFFQKKKELFFDKGSPLERNSTKTTKSTCADFENMTSGDRGSVKDYTKNFKKDLDDQSNVASGNKLTAIDEGTDIPGVNNIGPDTQLAAEAMGTLCFEVQLVNNNSDIPDEGVDMMTKAAKKNHVSVDVVTGQSKRATRSSIKKNAESLSSVNQTTKVRKWFDANLGKVSLKMSLDVNDDVNVYGKECSSTRSSRMLEQKEGRTRKRRSIQEIGHQGAELTGQKPETTCPVVEQLNCSMPVAHRTRKKGKNCLKAPGNAVHARKEKNDTSARVIRKSKKDAHDKDGAEMGVIKTCRKASVVNRSNAKCVGTSSLSTSNAIELPEPKRSHQKAFLDEEEADAQCKAGSKRSRDNRRSRNNVDHSGFDNGKVKDSSSDAIDHCASIQSDGMINDKTSKSAGAETIDRLDASPSNTCRTSFSTCTTPATSATPINNVSPICMGDEYHEQTCRNNFSRLSLIKEINSLMTETSVPFREMKDLRKRKDTTNIKVLFSQHLDVDVVKQQKKVLARLGASDAVSVSEATHFVADEFVRTRNMLEAIAFGKPVVTHLWLESCGQASCFVNEKNYILRDARKEKEFGFSMPVSLSRSSQHSLLQGQKVLVTPNTKPGKDIITNLVKAVHGLLVERLGRSALKDEKLPDDLLIISCEEDYEICVPFLEKGGSVYSSELLLNGIVKQKLEYERHSLFADKVKRTRSTIWVRKNQPKCR